MGMFDTIMVPCPKCGTRIEFQTKSGECSMAFYELAKAPQDALEDINRHAPSACPKCKAVVHVEFDTKTCEHCGHQNRNPRAIAT
jgi:uncharacterized protein YbjQ (UPF0145 family)